ncbi:glycosyltransferase family 2 protein [Polynucleobacter sp. HIN6]|uniref:glycosyltransferase family 2 protein n=1 Tax=Polynucleobacter sp. HIN6 TaxID=3047865 RepID=UPI0025725C95|nr:glycosyltransferase family 2 protein [Polynucleobacter sp. HIN6]BEI34783.1 glycosyltransferase family 2 protein [Polynucleobacter sp. HIN6]
MSWEVSISLNKNKNNLGQPPKPLVAILMGTKNGEQFLAEQLDSLETQTHQNWVLYASDDGSRDSTLSILDKYQTKWPDGKMIIRAGPQQGFCVNFLSLACDPAIRADYYAFCDQDDVWLSDKLTVAIQNILENQENALPYVYCGRTIYVDEELRKVGYSPLFTFPRTFRNALVQSIAGGNTMVFNHDVKTLLERVGPVNHISHDWWLYQLVTGVGGDVFYDPKPQLLYRQHKDALIGGNTSIVARCQRIQMVLQGQFRIWNDINIAILCSIKPLLSHGSQETLDLFKKMRSADLKDRFRLLEVTGLYRQTWRGTISLLFAALLKKI